MNTGDFKRIQKEYGEAVNTMRTFAYESRDGYIYREWATYEEAKADNFYISEEDDYFEVRNGELWIAVCD